MSMMQTGRGAPMSAGDLVSALNGGGSGPTSGAATPAATTTPTAASQQHSGIIWSKANLGQFPYPIDPNAGGVTTGSNFMLPDAQGSVIPGTNNPAYTYTTTNGQTYATPTQGNEQWNVANWKAANPPSHSDSWLAPLLGVAGVVGSIFLGPEVGALVAPELGLGATAADAIGSGLVGAGFGAASSAATGGNPLVGAATGGVGAGVGSYLSSGDVLGSLGLGSGTSAAAAGAGTDALGTGGSAATAALPASLGSVTPDTATSAGSLTGLVNDTGNTASDWFANNSVDQIAGAGAGGGAGAGTAAGSGGTWNSLTSGLSSIGSSLGLTGDSANTGLFGLNNNTVRDIAAVGGLGYDLSTASAGMKGIPGYNQLASSASNMTAQGSSLQSYLQNGTLPPGAQQAIDLATQSAIASVKGKYASMGLSGSTMEQQQIAMIQQNSASMGFQMADQLLSQGVSESQLGAELYQAIMGANIAQNQQTIGAITGLATALGGGININKVG